MPQFRTIEEFVLLLESWKGQVDCISDGSAQSTLLVKMRAEGMSLSIDRVLSVVRASNLGIVHPYSVEECPGHISASQKICCNCGIHIDSLRPD